MEKYGKVLLVNALLQITDPLKKAVVPLGSAP